MKLLTQTPNLTVSTASNTKPPINLQILLHGVENESDDEDNPHDCLTLIKGTTSMKVYLKQTPLEDNDLILFCDGSALRPNDTTMLADYAVVDDKSYIALKHINCLLDQLKPLSLLV